MREEEGETGSWEELSWVETDVLYVRGVQSYPKRAGVGAVLCFRPAVRHPILIVKALIEDHD